MCLIGEREGEREGGGGRGGVQRLRSLGWNGVQAGAGRDSHTWQTLPRRHEERRHEERSQDQPGVQPGEQPGERPGAARRAARSSQEQPGAARRTARSSQEQPGAARSAAQQQCAAFGRTVAQPPKRHESYYSTCCDGLGPSYELGGILECERKETLLPQSHDGSNAVESSCFDECLQCVVSTSSAVG